MRCHQSVAFITGILNSVYWPTLLLRSGNIRMRNKNEVIILETFASHKKIKQRQKVLTVARSILE